jgi:hypothetical protein
LPRRRPQSGSRGRGRRWRRGRTFSSTTPRARPPLSKRHEGGASCFVPGTRSGRDAQGTVVTCPPGEDVRTGRDPPSVIFMTIHGPTSESGASRADSIRVRWPDGVEESFPEWPSIKHRPQERPGKTSMPTGAMSPEIGEFSPWCNILP